MNVPTRRRGQTLIGIIVVVAIIIAAAGIYLSQKGKNPDGSVSSKTAIRRSVDLAQEVSLQSNLNQIQMFIASYKGDNEGQPPPTYDELKRQMRVPADFWINPVDNKPLGYNPATGTMIVTPYEGMSPNIIKMTQNPAQGTDAPSTPATGTAPSTPGAVPESGGAPSMPTIPNSGGDASTGESEQ